MKNPFTGWPLFLLRVGHEKTKWIFFVGDARMIYFSGIWFIVWVLQNESLILTRITDKEAYGLAFTERLARDRYILVPHLLHETSHASRQFEGATCGQSVGKSWIRAFARARDATDP